MEQPLANGVRGEIACELGGQGKQQDRPAAIGTMVTRKQQHDHGADREPAVASRRDQPARGDVPAAANATTNRAAVAGENPLTPATRGIAAAASKKPPPTSSSPRRTAAPIRP